MVEIKIKDKFGNWTVLDISNGKEVFCQCICGTKKYVQKKYLKNGKSKSCGCHGLYEGKKIGEFVLLKIYLKDKTNRYGLFKCKHGKKFESMIHKGRPRAKHCPCIRYDFVFKKHGESPHKIRTKEYNQWRSMRQRCNLKNNNNYHNYGGRGISVCKRWDDYSLFLEDMGRCPEGYSLDRIDNDGNYEPSNCRWATDLQQHNNKRNNRFFTFNGETLTVPQWSRKLGIPRHRIWNRIYAGWSFEKALIKEKRKYVINGRKKR